MIVVNPYGSLVTAIHHDEITADVISPTVTKYSYWHTDSVAARVLQCVVTVTNDGSGNFVSAKRTNT